MAAVELELPPIVPWAQWYPKEERTIKQGWHILFCGPTQSGKTTLCRMVSRIHEYVIVFGTKPVDKSLDAYVADGYVRIDHWPPTPSDIRKSRAQNDGAVRLLLWPKMKQYVDLKRHRATFAKCLEQVFVDGKWCLVIDEGLWVAGKDGLDLGDLMSGLAYGSASNEVSMHLLVQRPANLPVITWSSCMQALLFHQGRTDDVRELASLGTVDPKAAVVAMRTMNLRPYPDGRPVDLDAPEQLQVRRFLDLPCRGGARWSISEVDRALVMPGV